MSYIQNIFGIYTFMQRVNFQTENEFEMISNGVWSAQLTGHILNVWSQCRLFGWQIEIFNRLGIACVYCELSNDKNLDTRFHLTECRLERNSQISNAMHVSRPMFPLALKHINYSNKQTFWKWFSMAIELLMRSQNFLFIAHQNQRRKPKKCALSFNATKCLCTRCCKRMLAAEIKEPHWHEKQ